MKRDGRGFNHGTLETIRLVAVERVKDGERPSSVVASYGFNRTTIYRWLNAAATPGVGLRALRPRRRCCMDPTAGAVTATQPGRLI